jgi:hypothetical protein
MIKNIHLDKINTIEKSINIILFILILIILVYSFFYGISRGLESYIGPHSGGAFLDAVCATITNSKMNIGNYVCFSEVKSEMEKLNFAVNSDLFPTFLSNKEFINNSLLELFYGIEFDNKYIITPSFDGINGIGWGMDQGYADYIRLSFYLFGIKLESLYHLYWLLLISSFILYYLEYNKSTELILILFIYSIVIYISIYTDIFWSGSNSWAAYKEDINVNGLLSPRFLSTLCILPAFHLIFSVISFDKKNTVNYFIVFLQSVILFIAIQQRSTALWVLICPLFLYFYYFLFSDKKNNKLFFNIKPHLCIILLILIFKLFSSLSSYSGLAIKGFISHHSIWSSYFLTIQQHPDWKDKYAIIFDNVSGDGVAEVALKKYIEKNPEKSNDVLTQKGYENTLGIALLEFINKNKKFFAEVIFINNTSKVIEIAIHTFRTLFDNLISISIFLTLTMGFILNLIKGIRMNLLMISITSVWISSSIINWITLVYTSSMSDFIQMSILTYFMFIIYIGNLIGKIIFKFLKFKFHIKNL